MSERSADSDSASKLPQVIRDENGFRIKGRVLRVKAARLKEVTPDLSASEAPGGVHIIEIHSDMADGVRYIIEGAFRRVPPYFYNHLTYCKMRWRNRSLIDIFTSEFRDRDEEYYVSRKQAFNRALTNFLKRWAMKGNQVHINGKPATAETIVKDGDAISHTLHKHEPPVSSKPIKIVHEDDNLVVIDKPSGIPVHSTGRYYFNTVVEVLKHEHGINAHHRLTSGLMFLAKNPKSADEISRKIRDRDVTKHYLARVVGEFPLGDVTCNSPMSKIDPKLTLNQVTADGKEAKTAFKRISYDGETSMVLCKPFTGRTHQIRVHLQYLGYPIANDPIYSNPKVWGPELGKNGSCDLKDVVRKLNEIGKTEVARSFMFQGEGERLIGQKCPVCFTDLYSDPGPNDMGLWLHAMSYSADDNSWSYKTELPDWAKEVHLPFMKRALEEAKKCEATTAAFSVGALLVKDGEILETGYSRELPGNTHAEQCALEKYYAKHNVTDVPPGTVIYTTMEPCSLRLSGNLPCVERILKTCIKTVFVGVLEPKDFVADNDGQQKLANAGIEYIHVEGLEEECMRAAKKGHDE